MDSGNVEYAAGEVLNVSEDVLILTKQSLGGVSFKFH